METRSNRCRQGGGRVSVVLCAVEVIVAALSSLFERQNGADLEDNNMRHARCLRWMTMSGGVEK